MNSMITSIFSMLAAGHDSFGGDTPGSRRQEITETVVAARLPAGGTWSGSQR